MTPRQFILELSKCARPAKRMNIVDGDVGQVPVAKISGVPWWPKSCVRPHCDHGHPMAFMAQVLLKDVPNFVETDGGLLSFHYCTQCMYDGMMSHGYSDTIGRRRSYDVRVFELVKGCDSDGMAVLGKATLPSCSVILSDFHEVPDMEEMPEELKAAIPNDYFVGGDFEENDYHGLIHRPLLKLGGWPSWIQYPEWPMIGSQRMEFVCQIDSVIGEHTGWGGGGFAYLFVSPKGPFPRTGELSIQVN